MQSTRHIVLMVLLGLLLGLIACQKEETIRTENEPDFDNPFTGINDNNGPNPVNIDPESFLGIFNNILTLKCGANDGACHDGSFEPDYRTLFSAYNTLVYHQPTKNIIESINGPDTTWVYDYRVEPGDPDGSWLYHRITTDDEELGRMPLYDQALPEEEIDNIRQWILNGAPDPFGNLPSDPVIEPFFFGMLAFENDVNGARLDTARANVLEPMAFPQNTDINLWFGAVDYNEAGVLQPGAVLGYNKIKITDHLYNFDGVPEFDLSVLSIFDPPLMGPIFSQGPNTAPYYHSFDLNTADYEPGVIYYIRIYLEGVFQDAPNEYPETGGQLYWHTYLSFVVE